MRTLEIYHSKIVAWNVRLDVHSTGPSSWWVPFYTMFTSTMQSHSNDSIPVRSIFCVWRELNYCVFTSKTVLKTYIVCRILCDITSFHFWNSVGIWFVKLKDPVECIKYSAYENTLHTPRLGFWICSQTWKREAVMSQNPSYNIVESRRDDAPPLCEPIVAYIRMYCNKGTVVSGMLLWITNLCCLVAKPFNIQANKPSG